MKKILIFSMLVLISVLSFLPIDSHATSDGVNNQNPNTPSTTTTLHFSLLSPGAVQSSLLGPQDVVRSYSTNNLKQYPTLLKGLMFFEVTDCNPPHGNDLKSAIANAKLFPFTSSDYLVYDPEGSNGGYSTCQSELDQYAYYTAKAADATHKAGYLFTLDPTWHYAKNLYRNLNWTKIDMVVIQSQKHTSDPGFTTTITTEASYVHSENPKTRIYVQVNPMLDTTTHIVNAINSVKSQLYGVSIICSKGQGCTSSILTHLLTALGA